MSIIYVNITNILDLMNIFTGGQYFEYNAKNIDPSEKTIFDSLIWINMYYSIYGELYKIFPE